MAVKRGKYKKTVFVIKKKGCAGKGIKVQYKYKGTDSSEIFVLEENMNNSFRACAEINLDALKHNIQEIQAVLGDTKLMCVIKTNAYGHGSIVLARELAAMGAYGYAVSSFVEGI